MTSPVDPKILAAIAALSLPGETDVLVEVIDSFLKSSPLKLKTLLESIQRGSFAEISREAHSLKSSSTTLGAKHLTELCQKLEDLESAAQSKGHAEDIMRDLTIEHQHVCAELAQIRASRVTAR